jgi:hypothetical protein
MRLIILYVLLILVCGKSLAQYPVKSASYLHIELTPTLSDRTIKQNPWLTGLGLQKIFGSNTAFKGNLELTGAIYPVNDRVYRTNPDGSEQKTIQGMVNLFGGIFYKISELGYLSVVAGPSYVSGRVLLGVKPSLGMFFGKHGRTFGRISYIIIYNRDEYSKQDYKALSVSFGIKLN